MLRFLVASALVASAVADVYMHNPRGANCRLNEGNQNRQNAQRLYDTENNAQGGYGIAPRMRFYAESWLTVEWTNQHACGQDANQCQLILQYMCTTKDADDKLVMRDGTTTETIPNNEDAHEKTGGAFTYGMHESQLYYQECARRERNKGLFLADESLNGDSARFTRQQDNGQRHGFECNEERDYYPYWHPSPWKDIAVLVTDTSQCEYFRQNSQNVQAKGHCINEASSSDNEDAQQYNNRDACQKNDHTWVEDSAHGLPPPACLKAPWSRDNHLGNGRTDTLTGYMNHYNWSLPGVAQEPCIEQDNCVCVLRLRYNISTDDYEGRDGYDGWLDASANADPEENGDLESAAIVQDPYVTVEGEMLALALNTNQYGRVFQDRSHTFEIQPRPTWLAFGQRVHNLNVRGKRGNIVQTYPAVEYDFVPQDLMAYQGDYVHVQWTGFNDNPNNGNNNGEGTAGTDRSNMVQIASPAANMPVDTDADHAAAGSEKFFEDPRTAILFATLDQDDCKDLQQLRDDNNNNGNQMDTDPKNCMKLNQASQRFDGGLIKLNKTGTFHFMSTRNNNFSNRGQRSSITVMPVMATIAMIATVAGGVLCLTSLVAGFLMIQAKQNPMSQTAQFFERF